MGDARKYTESLREVGDMIKIKKVCLFILFAVCGNLNAMQQVYVSSNNRALIDMASGAFLDRLQENEGIASKRILTNMKLFENMEAHKENFEGLIPITEADWLYWRAIANIFKGDTPNVNEAFLNDILKAANNGCKDARDAVRISCKALSYSDAISEGEYSVKECLKNRILGIDDNSEN